MRLDCQELLESVAQDHPRPLLFSTVSGAHLYGFPSADSDFDIRGVHLATPDELFGLGGIEETIEQSGIREGREIDLVTHDARKFFQLMLKRNGYVLEQLHSPLVVTTTPAHEELMELAHGCVTRHHIHHYRGFAHNQWELLLKDDPPRVKPLLYVYRVILTGIHLMRTGEINANLVVLNEEFQLPFIGELVELKRSGAEKERIDPSAIEFHKGEFTALMERLDVAGEQSTLPDEPTTRDGINDLLVRLRRETCRE